MSHLEGESMGMNSSIQASMESRLMGLSEEISHGNLIFAVKLL